MFTFGLKKIGKLLAERGGFASFKICAATVVLAEVGG
jgi:hypothetical protein